MTKLLLAALAVGVLAVAVPSVVAQDEIVLGASFTNSLKFTGTGSGSFQLTLNSRGVPTRGTAIGVGPDIGGPNSCGIGIACNGVYAFIQSGPITAALTTPGCSATCIWSMASSGVLFDFGPKLHNSGQWLNGNVQFTTFTQVTSGGLFHDTMVANLSVIGGLLAQYFPNGGIIHLTLSFTTGQNLAALRLGQSVSDGVASGDVSQTPEPGTMTLLGSGMLFAAWYLRKRLSV